MVGSGSSVVERNAQELKQSAGQRYPLLVLSHLSIVEPFLDLIHLAILDGIGNVEVFHNDGHVTDDVAEHRSADDHPNDREPSFEVTGAGDVTVPHRGPERIITTSESGSVTVLGGDKPKRTGGA